MIRRHYMFVVSVFTICLIGVSAPSWAAVYEVDRNHTAVSFEIRNFMSNAHGFFHDFQGTVTFVPGDPKTWASEGTIQVESIDTKSAERDRHLLSKDFFEVGKFPEISFRATAVSQVAKNSAQVAGFIKIRGIEKPVSIRVQNLALSQDKNGIEHLKFIATAKIDRRDFGITYSSAGPGKMMLGNDVMITIEADAIRKD